MDEPVRAPRLSFAPKPALGWSAAAGALLAALLAILDSDGGGRLLIGIAAVVLAAVAVSDLAFTPRLAADGTGLTVRTPWTHVVLAWPEIEDVRVDEKLRLGLASRALEIDAGAVLIVLGARSLGRDPREALPLILALRP